MRILMPVDQGECSVNAIDFVASRKTLLKAGVDIELVNVQPPVPPRVAHALGRDIVTAHHEAEAAKLLQPAASKLRAAGANATFQYLVGTVGRDLVRVVRTDPADLIVMGSHGDSGVGHLLFGSVTEMVACTSTKPLLILRDRPPVERDDLKVGLALDGSPYGLATARFLAENRALMGERPLVTLIHVAPELSRVLVHGWIDREVPTGIRPEQISAMHDAAFRAVFGPVHDILQGAGIAVDEARLVGNDAGAIIASYAADKSLELLAMGSLGFGANRFASFGSVASRVASRVSTPLLLVREEASRHAGAGDPQQER